jgi:hypothetical protein
VILIFSRQIEKNQRSGKKGKEQEVVTRNGEKVIRRRATKDDWY